MAINPGILQALADPFNEPILKDDDSIDMLPEHEVDPGVKFLLESDLDPIVKDAIRSNERERLKGLAINDRIHRLQKKQEEDDPETGLISTIGGVPLGFQVGTWLGVKNGFLRLAMDIVLDPVNFISGGLGSLTKLGRAAKVLKGMTAAEKAEGVIRAARFAGAISGQPELAKQLGKAAASYDFNTVAKAFKKFSGKLSPDQLKAIDKADATGTMAAFFRNEKKELKGLKAAFKLQDKTKSVDEAKNFMDALVKGNRTLLSFKIPGVEEFSPFSGAVLEGFLKPIQTAKKVIEKGKEVGATFKSLNLHFSGSLDVKNLPKILDDMGKIRVGLTDTIRGRTTLGEAGEKVSLQSLLGVPGRTMVEMLQGGLQNVHMFSSLWRSAAKVVMSGENARYLDDVQQILEGTLTKGELSREAAERARITQPNLASFIEQGPAGRLPITRRAQKGKEQELFDSLPESVQKFVDETTTLLNDFGEEALDIQVIEDLLDNYLPHVIKVKDDAATKAFRDVLRKNFLKSIDKQSRAAGNRFGITRAFDTIKEAEKYLAKNPGAFEIVTKDVTEIVPFYINSMGRTIMRQRMLETAVNTFSKQPGLKMAMTKKMIDGLGEKARLAMGNYEGVNSKVLNKKGWVFHKDIAAGMRALYDDNILNIQTWNSPVVTNKMVQMADYMNSAAKSSLFGTLNPIFHTTALVLSQFAILGPKAAFRNVADITKFISLRTDPVAASEKMLQMMGRSLGRNKNTGYEMLHDSFDLFKEANLHLLKLGKPKEAEEGFQAFEAAMRFAASHTARPMKSAWTGLEHFNQMLDRNLWLVVQNQLKMMTYAQIRHAEVEKFRKLFGRMPDGEKAFQIGTEAAQITNQAFGGLAWERLGATPIFQKLARWSFLAPDWTLSNLLMARDMFVNIPGVMKSFIGKSVARDVILSDMRFRWAAGYNLRAALYGYAGASLANYAFTHWRSGGKEGRWLWQNGKDGIDPHTGASTRVELPYDRHDGRRQYMDLFKQFSEPLKLLHDPVGFYSAKMGVLPKVLKTVVVGVDGFGKPIAGAEDGPYKGAIKSIGATTGQFMPMPLQGLKDVARGVKDPRTFAINTLGFSVRSEDYERWQRRNEIKELRKLLSSP